MKFLFLDIDGVLNSETFLKQLDATYESSGKSPTHYAWENQIDRAAVARLNTIIKRVPNVCVILSSSWRLLVDPTEVQRILCKHGFAGTIVDATPDLTNNADYVRLRADNAIDRIARGHEIAYWLEWTLRIDPQFSSTLAVGALLHTMIERGVRIAILDDSRDMAHLTPWHVCVDAQVGLTDDDVDHAVQLLAGPPRS